LTKGVDPEYSERAESVCNLLTCLFSCLLTCFHTDLSSFKH